MLADCLGTSKEWLFEKHQTVFSHGDGKPKMTGASARCEGETLIAKAAAQAGMRWFDFGRSKRNTGSYAFKSQWGMRMDPLPYEVYLVNSKDAPNFSPVNAKFALSARLWSRLPLWATMKRGPHIVRWFP